MPRIEDAVAQIASRVYELERKGRAPAPQKPSNGRGTSFPSSPPTYTEWYRTDLSLDCFYDGTRWLTKNEYESDLQPFALNPLPYSTAAVNALLVATSRSDYNYYITRARAYAYINTTNNTTNYWGWELRDDNTTSVWAFDTHLGAPGENMFENAAINTVATISKYLTLTATVKTGAPGSIGALHCTVWYRLVIP